MENLIRIEFDPQRGGPSDIDFLRPRFRLSEWPSEEVEIWTSDDGGQTWGKLSGTQYRASYYPSQSLLYVSLLFNISDVTQIAFFDVDGNCIGAGYSLAKYPLIPLGWVLDGPNLHQVPIGWSTGSMSSALAPVGFGIEGGEGWNTPVGFNVKDPNRTDVPVGFAIAAPVDSVIGVGCSIGTVFSRSVGVGGTILGLGEFPASLLSLGDKFLAALSGEAAQRKQKMVTLNGTTPEELD